PLPPSLRRQLEPLVGADLTQVRVHAGAEAAKNLGARAFTVGSDIWLGGGQPILQRKPGDKPAEADPLLAWPGVLLGADAEQAAQLSEALRQLGPKPFIGPPPPPAAGAKPDEAKPDEDAPM